MAIIAIFSGSYCHGEDIAARVAEKLNYAYIGNELLRTTADKHNIPVEKLTKVMHGPTPFFNKLTHEKEYYTAYLRTTLAETIQQDNVVIHGFKTFLLPDNISHILRVCIIADHNYRVKQAVSADGISEKEADNLVRKFDNSSFQWSQYVTGLSPWDEELYDIIIPMHDSAPDKAVDIIIQNARKDAVVTTEQSSKAAIDFLLASKVTEAAIEKTPDITVSCEDGRITILINKFIKKLENKKEELKQIAESVPGVKEATVKVGPKFHVPSIYPVNDFEMPQKVLLVDDEKEFVHTLSERLQTRNLESAVVYDGEEALSFVEGDEPEVMVLDLKMPGIDGIEVLRRVKQSHPKTEVIILTGHGSEREEKLAAELGAFAYLQKPVDIDKLSDTMKQAYKKIRDARAGNE
jgi:CheY-like chemotaxis protein